MYEIEEFGGNIFIEELSKMHKAHLKLVQNQKLRKAERSKGISFADLDFEEGETSQKSLPAYVMGNQFAVLIKQLESLKCKDVKGAGKLQYSSKEKELRF